MAASSATRTAWFSVAAAVSLIAIKVAVGIASGSLAVFSEAVHSGTDLVAALLALMAVRVAGRPADDDHPYGHGKAEHLSALLEGMILVVASGVIVVEAIRRMASGSTDVTTNRWVFLSLGLVIVIDAARATASWRAARRHGSAALAASAVHFAGDLLGTLAVIGGLVLVRAGYPLADPIAAVAVAVIVLVASGRLMKANADILLDRIQPAAVARARDALRSLQPHIEVERLRVRSAAGRHFADAVVTVAPGAALAEAHEAADAVEAALESVLPNMDAVVHVEPGDGPIDERVRAAAQTVPGVREVHNVRLFTIEGSHEVSLHLKLPGDHEISEAELVAARVEAQIINDIAGVTHAHVHLEPLDIVARAAPRASDEVEEQMRAAIISATGIDPSAIRMLDTADGTVAHVTLALPGATRLDHAHRIAGQARSAARLAIPSIDDVVVSTTGRPTGRRESIST